MVNELEQIFQDTANAIREKSGESGTMTPYEFPERIAAIPTGGITIPVYDFPAMGLPNIVVGGSEVAVETDTSKLMQDLANGVVTFKMNITVGSDTIPAVKTCGGFVSNEMGVATITNIDVFGTTIVQSVVTIQNSYIIAKAQLLDNWVNTLIDKYMDEALGGDY